MKSTVNSVDEIRVPEDENDGLLLILVIVDEKSGHVFTGVDWQCPASDSTQGIACFQWRGRESHFGLCAPGADPCQPDEIVVFIRTQTMSFMPS